MKKALSIITSLIISTFIFAQESDVKEEEKQKRIETIKIIDGDTVVHDVRMIEGDDLKRRYRRVERYGNFESDEEFDEIIEDIDIYINVDDNKKKRIVKHLIIEDAEIEDIIESLGDDEDLVLDMEEGKGSVKVIKIEIDNENGEEVKVVKMHKEECHNDEGRKEGGKRSRGPASMQGKHKNAPQGLKVYPNPANDEINLEFGVPKGSETNVVIMDMDGNQIFNRMYKEPGFQQESIRLENKKEGIYIVTLKDDKRNVTKKIIVE